MKMILSLLVLFISVDTVFSQSIEDAYKRERGYLRAQKEALLLMKARIHTSYLKNKVVAEKEIGIKQAELSKLELSNQALIEEFKALEKITKESTQISSQIEKQNLKIAENLTVLSSKLGFIFTESAERDAVAKMEYNLDESYKIIEKLTDENWRKHAFINEENQLVAGEVLFNGLYSAWGKINSKIFSLAPYNKDFLKVIPNTDEKSVYFFTSDFNKVNVIVNKTWKESVADAVPGVVMAVIMLTVFGLFIMLARS